MNGLAQFDSKMPNCCAIKGTEFVARPLASWGGNMAEPAITVTWVAHWNLGKSGTEGTGRDHAGQDRERRWFSEFSEGLPL